MAVPAANTVWVDNKFGNDCKGELENPNKPFQTLDFVLKKLKKRVDSNNPWSIILRGLGPHYAGDFTPLAGTTIKGEFLNTELIGSAVMSGNPCIVCGRDGCFSIDCPSVNFEGFTLTSNNTTAIKWKNLRSQFHVPPIPPMPPLPPHYPPFGFAPFNGHNMGINSTWNNQALEQDAILVAGNLNLEASKVNITSWGGGKVNRSRQFSGKFTETMNKNLNQVGQAKYLTVIGGETKLDDPDMNIWTISNVKLKVYSANFLIRCTGDSKLHFKIPAFNQATGKSECKLDLKSGESVLSTPFKYYNGEKYVVACNITRFPGTTSPLGITASSTYKLETGTYSYTPLAQGENLVLTPEYGNAFYQPDGSNKIGVFCEGLQLYIPDGVKDIKIYSDFYFIRNKSKYHELEVKGPGIVSIILKRTWIKSGCGMVPFNYYKFKSYPLTEVPATTPITPIHTMKSNTSGHNVPIAYSTYNVNHKDTGLDSNPPINLADGENLTLDYPSVVAEKTLINMAGNNIITCPSFSSDIPPPSLLPILAYEIQYNNTGTGSQLKDVFIGRTRVSSYTISPGKKVYLQLAVDFKLTQQGPIYTLLYEMVSNVNPEIVQDLETHNISSSSSSTVTIPLDKNSPPFILSKGNPGVKNLILILNDVASLDLDASDANGNPVAVSIQVVSASVPDNATKVFSQCTQTNYTVAKLQNLTFASMGPNTGYCPINLPTPNINTVGNISLGDSPFPVPPEPNQVIDKMNAQTFFYDTVNLLSGDKLILPTFNYTIIHPPLPFISPITISVDQTQEHSATVSNLNAKSGTLVIAPGESYLFVISVISGTQYQKIAKYKPKTKLTFANPKYQTNNLSVKGVRSESPADSKSGATTDTLINSTHPNGIYQADNVVSNSREPILKAIVPDGLEINYQIKKSSAFFGHKRGGYQGEELTIISETDFDIPTYTKTINSLNGGTGRFPLIVKPSESIVGSVIHGTHYIVNNHSKNILTISGINGQMIDLAGKLVPTVNLLPGDNYTFVALFDETSSYWRTSASSLAVIT